MVSVQFNFPNEEEKNPFLGWLSDGGGEYEFMEYTDTKVWRFDYSDNEVTLELGSCCSICGDYMPEGHTCQ